MTTKKAPANVEKFTGGGNVLPCPKGDDNAEFILAQKVWSSLIAIYGAEHGAALQVREREAVKVG